MSKAAGEESSISERPISLGPRRLAEWLNPTGTKKVHSLVDKVYKKKNLELAWERVKQNKGSGGIDNVSIEKFEQHVQENLGKLHEELRSNTYKPQPVLQHKIPKAGQPGKFRKLGIPTYSDKLLQEVIRLILEAYYEPHFSESSHGFRPGRGCHTALQKVTQKGHGTKWFIEGDIKGCFDQIDHTVLLNILQKDFRDNRFLLLIKRLLQVGYLENWVYGKTHSGVPQGSIIGPILSNLVLNRLDKFMEEEMIPSFHKGKRRKVNPAYSKITLATSKAKKKGNLVQAKALNRQAQQMPSRVPDDCNFKRLWYVRYADDWLTGVIGTKAEAIEIKNKVAAYLRDELKLELSAEKTLVTHARKGKAKFLGYEIHTLHCDAKHTDGKRSVNGSIGLRVPAGTIKTHREPYMKGSKPTHRPERLKDEPYSIVNQYQLEYNGIVQYFRMAYNLHSLSSLKYTMEVSLVKTLANKYKTTCAKVYRRYGTTITIPEGNYKVLQVVIEREGKKPLETHFGAIPLVWNKWAHIDEDREVRIWSKRSEVVERLLTDQCEVCGKEGQIEMHHIRKLADIQTKHGKEVPDWKRGMSMRRRKSLAVCTECHHRIHRGEYNGKSLRKFAGEPRDKETVKRGSERGGWKSG